ncbi:MAG: hypothetical protein V8T01_04030 [Oscillospiraceae bacterium]
MRASASRAFFAVGFAIAWAIDVSLAMIFLHTYQTGEEPHTADLFQTFRKDRFLRVVGGMAWMSLWIFLWSLIPVVGIVFGVIRMYEYRFVPYILMTRDDVKPTDALRVSREQTMGYKGKMFWADVIPVLLGSRWCWCSHCWGSSRISGCCSG